MKKSTLLFVFLATLQTVFGQLSLLKDINPGGASSIAFESGATAQMGNTLFFSANTSDNGVELWKTDGTSGGTVMVKDIYPGSNGSNPNHFWVVGNRLFFTANDGVVGRELWVTDGTEAGTILLADIRPGISSAFQDFFLTLDFRDFCVFQDQLFFRAYTSTDGLELYKSDGTSAGTVKVKSIGSGANDGCQGDFTVLNGTLYFVGFTTTNGGQIWKTDGSEAGTVAVTTVMEETPSDLTTLGNRLIFVGDDGVNGPELWVSDGTNAGTVLLADTDTAPGSGGLSHSIDTPERRFFVADQIAYFSVVDEQFDNQVWVTDGTAGGTFKLVSVGFSNCGASHFARINNTVFFTGCDFEDKLWKTTGEPFSAEVVQSYGASPFSSPSSTSFPLLHTYDNNIWYGAGDFEPLRLYKTFGDPNFTEPVGDFSNYLYEPQRFANLGSKLIVWAKLNQFSDDIEPYVLQPTLTVLGFVTPVKCNGGSDGAISLSVLGTAPFVASWFPATVTGLNPTNLPAGFYEVTVTDAEGATGFTTFSVPQPAALTGAFSATPQMDNLLDGTASVNVNGGTPPYQYAWNTTPVQTTSTATGLVQGTYTCLVTDAKGCTLTGSILVNQVVGTFTAIEEHKITLAPNPADAWLNVRWGMPESGEKTYRVLDAKGTLMRTFVNPAQDQLGLNGLPSGYFVLEILVDNRLLGYLPFIKK